MKSQWIVVEGPDGSGKTTIAQHIRHYLYSKHRFPSQFVREPGVNHFGNKIRELILSPSAQEMSPLAERLLFMSDHQLFLDKVLPDLKSQDISVVLDRYCLISNLAYAHGKNVTIPGHNIKIERLEEIHNNVFFATPNMYLKNRPDMIFILDVDPKVAQERLDARKAGAGESNYIDELGMKFKEAVREGYKQINYTIASRIPVIVIDANQPIDVVKHQVESMIDYHAMREDWRN